jgi:hypothetical protein
LEKYFDKNGKEIKAGMKIKHDDGDIELVHANYEETDLGINASTFEIYPLYQFNLKEWEILEG